MKENWTGNKERHRSQIDSLRKSKEHTAVTKFILRALLVAPSISPANWFLDPKDEPERKQESSRGMDYYISLLIGVLTLMLLGFTVENHFWWLDISSWWKRVPIAVVPTLRIVDIISYRLYFLFHKSVWKPWQPRYARRSLGIAFANFYEVVVSYAILFLLTREVCNGNGPLKTGLDAAYFSLVTITTVGYGDFVATNNLSRILVMSELVTGLLLLIIIVPALVSLFSQPPTSLEKVNHPRVGKRLSEMGSAAKTPTDQPEQQSDV